MSFTLPRGRIIRGKRDIEALLEKGESFFKYPIRATCILRHDAEESRMMVSVPKRLFHDAVDRNLLKRRIREAFRKNSGMLERVSADILFVYVGKETADYERIENSVKAVLAAVDSSREVL